MIELKHFRQVNDLTQEQLGNYLGISKGFVSRIEHDKEKLPFNKLRKLMENSNGWDTSMIPRDIYGDIFLQTNEKGANNMYGDSALKAENDRLRAEVEALKRELEQVSADKKKYWDVLSKVFDTIK